MPFGMRNIADIAPRSCASAPPIGGRMTDIGRTLGSQRIGRTIQAIAPGHGRRAATGTCSRARSGW